MSDNPLTLFWLFATVGFELGLGVSAYVSAIFLIPRLRNKSNEILCFAWKKSINNRFLAWLIDTPYLKGPRIEVLTIRNRPQHPTWYIPYKIAVGTAYFVAFGVLGSLLTSTALKLPDSWDNLVYDFLWARANGQPNGAHIFSYLGIPIILLFVAWKFHDVWLGFFTAGLLVSIHEVIWTALYYTSYYPYLNMNSAINLFKDFASFYPMLFLFIGAFIKYRPKTISIKTFRIPIIVYSAFLAIWYTTPKLFLGYQYFLPVTCVNLWNPDLAKTVYQVTIYWNDPLTAFFEVTSWVLLAVLMIGWILKK